MNQAEEEFYAIAGSEVTSRTMAPGLMAKALVDSGGDERAAVTRYIELRVQQLKSRAASELAKCLDKDAAREVKFTKCPACGYVGKMLPVFWTLGSGVKCPNCKHRFEWYHFKGE